MKISIKWTNNSVLEKDTEQIIKIKSDTSIEVFRRMVELKSNDDQRIYAVMRLEIEYRANGSVLYNPEFIEKEIEFRMRKLILDRYSAVEIITMRSVIQEKIGIVLYEYLKSADADLKKFIIESYQY